jgi:hypothetical protein
VSGDGEYGEAGTPIEQGCSGRTYPIQTSTQSLICGVKRSCVTPALQTCIRDPGRRLRVIAQMDPRNWDSHISS